MNDIAAKASATHYQVLQLSPIDGRLDLALLKAAYHRALLLHHPDKKRSKTSQPLSSLHATASPSYSIDQINEAYKTLSSVSAKATYDQQLREEARAEKQSRSGDNEASHITHSGIEIYDLEDLLHHPEQGVWTQGCRCGHEPAYTLDETDLQEVAPHGQVDIVCKGCSLSIRVLFHALDPINE